MGHCTDSIKLYGLTIKHFEFLHHVIQKSTSSSSSSSLSLSLSPSLSMESPSTTRLATSLCCICVLLSFTTTVINPVVALENCKFPAIFNLGDSNSDTGGYAAAFSQPPWPYGRTFFRMPAGRFSDGRLMIDFIGTIYLLFKPIFCISTSHWPRASVYKIGTGDKKSQIQTFIFYFIFHQN